VARHGSAGVRVNSGTALQGFRIGCVQYLNAKPLMWGYQGPVVFEHPSRLAGMLAEGELDIALVPVFELFRGKTYRVVDGVAIASRGPVFSVFLAYRGDLSRVSTVALDHASLTSANLLRCLLAEFHGMTPRYVSENSPAEARLLIGNQAIAFRQRHPEEYQFLDLGEEWTAQTGLPFVYALWLVRPEVASASEAAAALRRMKTDGVAHLEEVIAGETHYSRAFCESYLREFIRYEFGEEEKAGLRKFHELSIKHGLAPRTTISPEFI
jgi:chorismate dehydratase